MSETPRLFDRTTPPHLATLVAMAGVAMLSMNTFLPSLPAMAVHFGVDYAWVQLSVSAYLAMTAGLHIVIGPLSDRYGRRAVLLGAFLIYVMATLGCLLAPNFEVFLAFRLIQASVTAGMVLSRAIVRDLFSTDRAASMIGYVTMITTIVPMIGPVLGGYMQEAFGWKANFVVFAVAGVLALLVMYLDLGETHAPRKDSFASQLREYPELLASRRFWGYALTAAFASGAFFSFLGGGPFVATQVFGLSPSQAGFTFAAIAIGYMTGNFLSGRFSMRYGVNRMCLTGCAVASVGLGVDLALYLSGFVSVFIVFGGIFFVGLGNGLTLPNANAGFLSVRPHLAGSAAGLGGALMIGGGAGVSVLTGALLTPETGAAPMLAMMAGCSLLSLVTMAYVIRRARVVGAQDAL